MTTKYVFLQVMSPSFWGGIIYLQLFFQKQLYFFGQNSAVIQRKEINPLNAFIKQLFPEKRFALLLGVAFPMLWMSAAGLFSAETYLICNIGIFMALLGVFLLQRKKPEITPKLYSSKATVLYLICLLLPAADIFFPSDLSNYLWLFGGFGLGAVLTSWFNLASGMPFITNVSSICLGTAGAFLVQLFVEISLVFHLGNAEIWSPLLKLFRGGDVAPLVSNAAIDALLLIFAAVFSVILLVHAFKENGAPNEDVAISASKNSSAQDIGLPKPGLGFVVGLFAPFALLAFYFGFSHDFPSGILANAHASLAPALTIGMVLILGMLIWLVLRINHSDATRTFGMVTLVMILLGMVALFIDRNNKTFLLATQVCSRAIVVILLWILATEFAKRNNYPPLSTFCSTLAFYTAFLCLGLFVGTRSFTMEFLVEFPQEGIYLFTACMAVAIIYGLLLVADFLRESIGSRELTVVLETSFLDQRCTQLAAKFELSERETEIIQLLAQGRSRSYIAENLYLSENTVKWYCRQIYQKLDIHKKQELLTLLGVK